MLRRVLAPLALAALAPVSLAAGGNGPVFHYVDDDFKDADWELIPLPIGSGGSASTLLVASGGCASPPYREVALFIGNPTATEAARVFGFHRKKDAVYSPSVEGPITKIDYAECAGALGGFSHGTGPALRQGGQVFLHTGTITTGALPWHTISLNGLTEDQFDLVDFNPVTGTNPNVHPDFSVAGADIELGFFRGLGLPPGFVGNVGSTTYIDHWRMTITSCPVPSGYCTGGTSASGCTAQLSATGLASATASTGFTLQATFVEGLRDGLFFYGTNGRQANPWGNGTSRQCVVPPVKRAGLMTGIGNAGACNGIFAVDLNALWAANPKKSPGPSTLVQAQLWYRDPLNTSNQTTSLSDALEFWVAP